jgi:hypothetical protein
MGETVDVVERAETFVHKSDELVEVNAIKAATAG